MKLVFLRKQDKTKKSINSNAMKDSTKKERDARKRIKKERTAQNMIRYNMMLEDGICVLGDDLYSKSVLFKDINYQIAPDDVQHMLILQYKSLLNSLGNEVDVSLVINNRLINKEEFEENILMKHRGDGLDDFRAEINEHLRVNMHTGNNSIISDKMFVFSCKEENVLEARKVLSNLEKDFQDQLHGLGCETSKMSGLDRMKILKSITMPGKSLEYTYSDLVGSKTTKDWITPYSYNWKKDYFEMGDRFCSVMFLANYPTYLNDDLIYELSKLENNLLITLHMKIMSKDEAMELINKKSQLTEIQVDDETQKRRKRMDFSDTLPPGLAKQVESIREWRTAVEKGDERIFKTKLEIMINARSYDEMEQVRREVVRIGKRCAVEFLTMEYEQEMGFNEVLPLGIPVKFVERHLLTDNLSNIMPFTSQELMEEDNPTFYGINQTTYNMVLCNRRTLPNGNGFILGETGSGKSFAVKKELTWAFLNDDDTDIIIIDPQGEYRILAEEFNKQANKPQCDILEISSSSKLYFNPFDGDMSRPDFVREKADFLQVLMAEMIGSGNGKLTPEQRSIVDQTVYKLYGNYEMNLEQGNYDKAIMPTLQDFYEVLGEYNDPVANAMQKALWIYVYGTYDLFAHQANVQTNRRLIVYDIHKIGKTIERLGLKVVLESVRDRVLRNHEAGRRTLIYIDEIYLLLRDEYSENFLYEFWKWVRKYGGACTGMTQNVSDLLRSQKGCAMLENSKFFIILAQGANELQQLSLLLKLSEEQARFVLTARKGSGLIRFGETIIPFSDEFPKDTLCYKIWNTDPKSEQKKTNRIREKQKEAIAYQKEKEKSQHYIKPKSKAVSPSPEEKAAAHHDESTPAKEETVSFPVYTSVIEKTKQVDDFDPNDY